MEEGEEAGVFGFGDGVEGELVEVFEEPGAGEGVVFFGTEVLGLLMFVLELWRVGVTHVYAGDGQAG